MPPAAGAWCGVGWPTAPPGSVAGLGMVGQLIVPSTPDAGAVVTSVAVMVKSKVPAWDRRALRTSCRPRVQPRGAVSRRLAEDGLPCPLLKAWAVAVRTYLRASSR